MIMWRIGSSDHKFYLASLAWSALWDEHFDARPWIVILLWGTISGKTYPPRDPGQIDFAPLYPPAPPPRPKPPPGPSPVPVGGNPDIPMPQPPSPDSAGNKSRSYRLYSGKIQVMSLSTIPMLSLSNMLGRQSRDAEFTMSGIG